VNLAFSVKFCELLQLSRLFVHFQCFSIAEHISNLLNMFACLRLAELVT